MKSSVRTISVFIAVTFFFAAGLWLASFLLRPALPQQAQPLPPALVAEGETQRDVRFDPANTPTMHRKIAVAPAGEAPILSDLVSQQKLPPLKDRLPDEPVVMTGDDGIGKYGGTWMRLSAGDEDVGIITYRMSGPYLARWSPLGYPIEAHIAKTVESSPDKRIWTIHLRKGLRWSDGHPFTADDILYWWECEALNKTLASAPPNFMINAGKVGRISKVDDVTVRVEFDEPDALFLETLAMKVEFCGSPAHYLRQYHPDPKIGNAAVIARDMKHYKLPSARSLYTFMKDWRNPEHPRLWPWVYRTARASSPHAFVRNPYYYVLDPAGNQLPYIDRVQFDAVDLKMLALTAANGGVTMQGRHIRFTDYTELMSRRNSAGTRILHWYPAVRSAWAINPNQNRRIDPNDRTTNLKAELLSNKKFRQALSIAINREQIIKAEYNGIGEPAQVAPGKESPFYYEPLVKAYTQFDPAKANKWLDELGLSKRDSEGYRTFPDGTRMTFYLDYTTFTGLGPTQFVVDDWAAVGIRTIFRERARPLFYAEKDSLDFDFNVWSGESDHMPLLQPRYFVANDGESFYGAGWGRWYMRGGFYDTPESRQANCIAPPPGHPMLLATELYEKALHSPEFAEQKKYMDQVLQIAAENTWTISIATPPPNLVVVDKNLRNVPENALWGVIFATPANAGIETYFFENPTDSPGAIAATAAAILTPTLRAGASPSAGVPFSQRLIKIGMWTIPLLLLLMIALRHPFIGRRVLIMVPTLLLISVLVFVTIRLPPGDYLTTRLILLQESGDPTNEQLIEDLRRMFHFEEPAWKLYLRWMGLRWFVTFDAADEGLLQGNLGRSMETTNSINTLVGDRITLTILISLGTILFTWAVALPIGIYSAVRQYSIADYVLTLLGFAGMCIPAFLLALILMTTAEVSGLFSPEFARQPEWTWAKFVDLLKHVWVPIVVLGVGGTAAMIRVMRANLLDELRKPYVITAMAKGVRPMKLLLKYPVRLALNPFVSGIGGLFPQLVSGGAIVSMVLALPMVGPLLLQALFTEDMYLAGSMLMVLSILGVVGTLVSDLLLLWLDPRIRLEGGSR